MATSPTFPGVYIVEVPSGVRPITGVATSIAAFIDRFPRGVADVAVHLFSFADFEREFGGLDTNSEASYGLQQFFLNGGTEAYVVRVGPENAANPFTAASFLLTDGAGNVFRATAGRRILGAAAENPGLWGNNLRIEVDYNTTDPTELFNLQISEVALQAGRTVIRQTETFRNLTIRPGLPNSALDVVNESSKLVQLDRTSPPAFVAIPALPTVAPRPLATGTMSGILPAPVPASFAAADGQAFTITLNPGAIALNATIDYGGAPDPVDYAEFRPYLEAAIRASDPTRPMIAGATVTLISTAGGANDRYQVLLGRGGTDYRPDATIAFADTGGPPDPMALAMLDAANATVTVQQYQPGTQGADGLPVTDAAFSTAFANAARGVRSNKTGLYALEDADLFNIVCIPKAADLGGTDMRAVYAEVEAYCEEKRAFLIVDIPQSVASLDAMQTWLSQNSGLRSRNAAVYFPRVRIADALNQNRLRSVGPSGTMAGVYAQTDGTRGVWKAPAGTEARLRNVQELDDLLTDRENGALNPAGVNCLRNFPIIGNVSWGARTLDGADALASEWKYIPVRRTALFLEESLFRGTKWVVFEPNDEPLWSQIRLNLGAFMQRLFRQGAFQGQTPKEAYFVKCDKETTTQADIDLGIVNIVVGFAPLKPAEFVIIRIQQIAGQIPT
jgi:phage tail sheath protein FI